MAYEYSDLVANVKDWSQQATNTGWLDQTMASSMTEEKHGEAKQLFQKTDERPLVVAFMGGTGVGKSSLLNKLAGQSIAKSGVERPTSREVTLFHHQSISLHQLEEKFPLQQIQLSQHTNPSNEKVIWIDMPDFDSTEEKNKHIVLQWLPYIDVLIYVVSPERYRDNKAWQLLLAEGASHAWLFVINQWDKGESAQYDDFKQQLNKAGFSNPVIFKTTCIDEALKYDDELDQLQARIESLANKSIVEQIELQSTQQRSNHLKHNLQQGLHCLGSEQGFSKLLQYHAQSWSQTETVLNTGFEWLLKQAAVEFSKTASVPKQNDTKLWDDWAQSRFNDYLDNLILTTEQHGIPLAPVRKELLILRKGAEKTVQTQTELACRQSLVNPGNLIQRMVLKIVNICEIVLPITALSVVGYQVFQGYYDSSITNEAFLGVNFAVHSLLLILLSWLIPFFIKKKLQPSLEKAALRGLIKGLDIALKTIELNIAQLINELKTQHQQITEPLKSLIKSCDEQGSAVKKAIENKQLNRMLVDK
ncbi:MAG: 50S ribosome-binding GTPase [Methylococcales bacterium]|nr:50S ribosome-binding GTPase [Methylococcales bacterium]